LIICSILVKHQDLFGNNVVENDVMAAATFLTLTRAVLEREKTFIFVWRTQTKIHRKTMHTQNINYLFSSERQRKDHFV